MRQTRGGHLKFGRRVASTWWPSGTAYAAGRRSAGGRLPGPEQVAGVEPNAAANPPLAIGLRPRQVPAG